MFQVFRKELMWGGRRLVLETGKIARQADGAVMATYGETTVLCTAVDFAKRRHTQGIWQFPRQPQCSQQLAENCAHDFLVIPGKARGIRGRGIALDARFSRA